MIGVTLKGLLGRKLRTFLTALAVVIGVAMVSGAYVLTDTMQKAFDGIFAESYEGTDAVISGKKIVDFSSSGRATVSADLLDDVRALPGVEAAAGEISDLEANSNAAKLVDENGKAIGGRRRGADLRRRDRLERAPLQPARAHRRQVGQRRRPGRDRRQHGGQVRLRRRRHGRHRRTRAGEAVRDHRRGRVRIGRLDRRSDHRDLRPADCAGSLPEGRTASTRSRSRPRKAFRRPSS